MINVFLSKDSVRIELPFSPGSVLVLPLKDALQLRDALVEALGKLEPNLDATSIALAVIHGRSIRPGETSADALYARKIHAIQRLRMLTGCGLVDAKEAIEAYGPL